jgi:hypothetical protein
VSDCPRHKHCAYTGTEPGLCRTCHTATTKCAGKHGGAPYIGWDSGVAGDLHPALRTGQSIHPREAHSASQVLHTAPQHTSEKELVHV